MKLFLQSACLLAVASLHATTVINQTLSSYTSNTGSAALQEIESANNAARWQLTNLIYGGIGNFSSSQANASDYSITFWTTASANTRVGNIVTASSASAPINLPYGWKRFDLTFDLSSANIVYDFNKTIYFSIQTATGVSAWTVSGTANSTGNFSGWYQGNGTKTAMTLSADPVIPEPSTYGLVLGGLALCAVGIRRRRKVAA